MQTSHRGGNSSKPNEDGYQAMAHCVAWCGPTFMPALPSSRVQVLGSYPVLTSFPDASMSDRPMCCRAAATTTGSSSHACMWHVG